MTGEGGGGVLVPKSSELLSFLFFFQQQVSFHTCVGDGDMLLVHRGELSSLSTKNHFGGRAVYNSSSHRPQKENGDAISTLASLCLALTVTPRQGVLRVLEAKRFYLLPVDFSPVMGRSTVASGPQLFFNEIAGFETGSRPYLLKYAPPLSTPTSPFDGPMQTRKHGKNFFHIYVYSILPRVRAVMEGSLQKIAGLAGGGIVNSFCTWKVSRLATRAMIEVHHFFSNTTPQFWELKTSLRQELIWRKIKLLSSEKSHGLGTQRESSEKKK